MDIATHYHTTIAALMAAGVLQFIQLLVSDVAGLKAGHKPGNTIEFDHRNFHFRSARTVTNMNESIAIFLIFAITGIFAGADPVWLGRLALAYAATRGLYALCYWFNVKTLRSVIFGFSLLALLGMIIVSVRALFA